MQIETIQIFHYSQLENTPFQALLSLPPVGILIPHCCPADFEPLNII